MEVLEALLRDLSGVERIIVALGVPSVLGICAAFVFVHLFKWLKAREERLGKN